MIEVTLTDDGDPMIFDVAVSDHDGRTRHEVSLPRPDFERLGAGAAPERLIDAAFRFLLDREPKEAILPQFELAVISRYFPDFERQLPAYLG